MVPGERHGMRPPKGNKAEHDRGRATSSAPGPVDLEGNLWPCCIVWTWLPGCTQCTAGVIGHTGIGTSRGDLWEFLGDGASEAPPDGGLAFGPIIRYLQLDPSLVRRGTWDEGISTTVQKWRGRMHGACVSNCHSFVADCLDEMRYAGVPCWSWLPYLLAVWVWVLGRFPSRARAAMFLLPIIVVLAMLHFMFSTGSRKGHRQL
mmetsp:Transcript_100953/g.263227  ORF Transcript_100953/g.263227 Transcript_100953/m.263227 type:complete len:204 (-) Transcript_100953:255-866(-)